MPAFQYAKASGALLLAMATLAVLTPAAVAEECSDNPRCCDPDNLQWNSGMGCGGIYSRCNPDAPSEDCCSKNPDYEPCQPEPCRDADCLCQRDPTGNGCVCDEGGGCHYEVCEDPEGHNGGTDPNCLPREYVDQCPSFVQRYVPEEAQANMAPPRDLVAASIRPIVEAVTSPVMPNFATPFCGLV